MKNYLVAPLISLLLLCAPGFANAQTDADYESGKHFFSLPLNFSPEHSFTSDWSNKVVIHPEAFPEFNLSTHKYTLKIEASSRVQTGFAKWTGGKELDFCGEEYGEGSFEINIQSTFKSRIKEGYCFQLNEGGGTLKSVTLEITEKTEPDPEPVYTQGVHIFSLPVNFSPEHSFTTGWNNKLVIHPEAFPEMDLTTHTYTLKISGSGTIQTGFGLWEDGKETSFSNTGNKDGSFDLTINKLFVDRLAKGYCFQLNGESGSVSSVKLEVTEGGYVEPDYSKGGFHTDGTRLLDANDNEFVMRGINYSWGWNKDKYWQIESSKDWGFNTIRIQIGAGGWIGTTSVDDIRGLIEECEKNKLVAVFNVQDYTGSDSADDLRHIVNYWCNPEMVELFNEHRATVILNVTNEWPTKMISDGGEWTTLWRDSYCEALPKLRDAGFHNSIMIDCGGYGQDYECIPLYGRDVYEADPAHNIIFSMHMYQTAGYEPDVVKHMSDAMSAGCPVVFGEIAYEHKANKESWPNGGPVAWKEILEYSYRHNLGWIGWSWSGNGGNAETCDMFGGEKWQPLENGKCLIYGQWGSRMTSTQCTVFDSNPEKGQPYRYPDPSEYADETFRPFPYPGEEPDDVRKSMHTYTPELDPSRQEAPGEIISRTLPYGFNRWNDSEIYIRPEYFDLLFADATMRFDITGTGAGSHLQLYYTDPENPSRWYALAESYDDLSDGILEVNLWPSEPAKAPARAASADVPDVRAGLRTGGMYIKGRKLTVNGISFDKGDLTGVDGVRADAELDAPAEIYTLTCMRVTEMLPGRIYVVRRGNTVTRIRK